MKKLFFLAFIALLAIGTVSAQGWGFGWGSAPETVRVEGTLQLQNGHIALSTGTAVYFVPGLGRYIGFIDGLREGARISAEGFVADGFLRLTKFTLDGREYDFGANAPGWGAGGQRGGYACCGFGPMGGGYGPRGGGYGRGHHRGRW